jgi:hypothetical protein
MYECSMMYEEKLYKLIIVTIGCNFDGNRFITCHICNFLLGFP